MVRYKLEGLNLVKEAGCNLIEIGCESGNSRVLNLLKNGSASIEQNRNAIYLCNQAKIKACASFIIGTPSETLLEMKDTLKFIMDNEIYAGGIGIATPYPGTALFKLAFQRNLIPSKIDYSKYKPSSKPEEAFIICDTMPKEEFIKVYNKMNKIIGEKILFILLYTKKESFICIEFPLKKT